MKEIAPEPAEEPVPEPEESPSFVINRAEPAPDVEEAEPFAEEPYEPVRESKRSRELWRLQRWSVWRLQLLRMKQNRKSISFSTDEPSEAWK